MTAKNDHTGALMNTKAATDLYREGYDRIFGKKEKVTAPYVESKPQPLHTESLLDHLAHRDAEHRKAEKPLETRQQIHDEIVKQVGHEYLSPPLHGGPASATREMSDREWARLPANLREGCITHVDGVGDI